MIICKTNKRQKFPPRKPLPFCLLFEENKEFCILGIHPYPSAPTPRQNKICSLQKSGLAKARQKEKHTSYNSVYAVRTFPESPLPYLLRKHRIHANVICNYLKINMSEKRVSAIIHDKEKILLVHRIKNGNEYFVLPGGSVENGEQNIEALVREIKEETNLNIEIDNELWQINDSFDKRTQHIYLISKFTGELKLGSPEKERQSENNRYYLEWHKPEYLKTVKFFPEEIKANILKTFLGNSI